MSDAPDDEVMAGRIPLDRQSLPQVIPFVLQVSPLHGESDPDEFFYDPFADVESGAARAFFVHHGHIVVFHDCPNAMAFQNLSPLAAIAYISLLPKGLIAKRHCLLEAQRAALLCPSPHPAVRVLAPPCLLLDSYVAAGFAGAQVGLPLASTHSNASAFACNNGLIWSPSVSSRGYKLSTAVPLAPPPLLPLSSLPNNTPSLPLSALTLMVTMSPPSTIMGGIAWHGGSYPRYGGSGMPANWHSSS
jgi:hypothetical protein